MLSVANGGTGLAAVGTDQVPVGTSGGAYVASVMGTRVIAYATALSLTASGDTLLTMSNAANLSSYIVRRVTWGLPLTSALATVIIVATVRTASAGGGSAITGGLVVTGLSATTAPMALFNSSTVPYVSTLSCDFKTRVPPNSDVCPLSPVLV